MAVNVAKLSTISTLDSTQFGAGIKRMQVSLSGFSSISLGAFARIGSMATDMAVRVARAIPGMVLTSLRAGDALDELASQLGFNAGSLANLQRVAGLAGIELGQLETIIGKMNATLGEAQGGNKAAIDSFADLGVNFKALIDKSPEDTLFAIIDALKQIPGVARRTALERSIFGRGGGGVERLVAGGSAGIRGQMATTAGLGIATRPGDLAAMGRASDVIDDLKNNLKGLGDQIAIRLSPIIESLGKAFLNLSIGSNLAAKAGLIVRDAAMNVAGVHAKSQDILADFLTFLAHPIEFTRQKSVRSTAESDLVDAFASAIAETDRLTLEQNKLLKDMKAPIIQTAKNTSTFAQPVNFLVGDGATSDTGNAPFRSLGRGMGGWLGGGLGGSGQGRGGLGGAERERIEREAFPLHPRSIEGREQALEPFLEFMKKDQDFQSRQRSRDDEQFRLDTALIEALKNLKVSLDKQVWRAGGSRP